MFGIVLKVSVRLVNWSQFHSSHLYYEKYWKLVELCSAEEGVCPPLGICENVYLSPARCDPGAQEPKNQKVFYVFTTDLKISLLSGLSI